LIFLFSIKEKITNIVTVTNRKHCWSVVIMSVQNEEEIIPERNPNQRLPKEPRHNNDRILATQVLETMKNIIMELQVFKAYNEKMKKAHEHWLEINEMLL
jgi:hypothetical protein